MRLDYVVSSVHSSFSQSIEEMTARIIKAIEHPATTMLGHLTGRLLLKKEMAMKWTLKKWWMLLSPIVLLLNLTPTRTDWIWIGGFEKSAAEKGYFQHKPRCPRSRTLRLCQKG